MIDLNVIAYIVLFFFIFSFGGWLFECAISLFRDHEVVNRGFYNGPYCPIYGSGALLFLLVMQWTDRPLELFFFGGLVACVLEYFTSWLMEKLYKARWWDYSNWPFNINGRVCLYGFLTFGTFSALMPFMKKGIDWLIALIPSNHQITIAIIILVIFIIDFIYSNHIVISFNRSLRKIQKQLSKSFPLNITNRGRRAILYLKVGDKKYKLLNWQQRRLLSAFPTFRSKYDKALRAITEKHRQRMREFQKNRFKPITSRELKAAKAKAKREGKKHIDARKSNKY